MGRPHEIGNWTPDTWLPGLETIFHSCRGASVLDVGCHNGLVLRFFGEHGANVLHGIDIWSDGLNEARRLVDGDSRYLFGLVDFKLGFEAIEKVFPLRVNYDIILYCAVHHHLARQIGEAPALQFAQQVFSRGAPRSLVIIRGAYAWLEKLGQCLVELDFSREISYVVSDKGGVHVWRRT